MGMDNNEAVERPEAAAEVTITTIDYCASLLRVSPSALLGWMVRR